MSVLSEVEGRRSSLGEPGWVARFAVQITAWLRGRNRTGPRSLQHVETLSLGPKRSVFLIECNGERFLVSAGGDGLSAPVPLKQRSAGEPDADGRS